MKNKILTSNKEALIGQIRKHFHPGSCPARFLEFVRYTGGLEQGGIREQEWYYKRMLKSNFQDLKFCLELLQRNFKYRMKLKPDRPDMDSAAWLTKITDEMVYNKLAGLTKEYECQDCGLKQFLYDGRQPFYRGSECDYCGTELK